MKTELRKAELARVISILDYDQNCVCEHVIIFSPEAGHEPDPCDIDREYEPGEDYQFLFESQEDTNCRLAEDMANSEY